MSAARTALCVMSLVGTQVRYCALSADRELCSHSRGLSPGFHGKTRNLHNLPGQLYNITRWTRFKVSNRIDTGTSTSCQETKRHSSTQHPETQTSGLLSLLITSSISPACWRGPPSSHCGADPGQLDVRAQTPI